METDFRANNGFRKKKKKLLLKRIHFPLNKNSDFASRNEGFVKEIFFQYTEKLLSPAGIYIYRTRRKWFSIVGEVAL